MLRAEKINKHYDGVYALHDAEFEVRAGEVHALMGENGAGKSTLAKVIAGSVRADSGSIFINGERVQIASPLDAQRLGIGIIYQELDLFPNLTVAENIAIGNLKLERKPASAMLPYLEQVGLGADPRTPVAALPIGEMQLVALARALALDARLILMDEPTSSLAEDAVERLFGLIRALRDRGVSVVYVSHKMDEIFRISDRITVLRDGATIGTRAAAETNVDEIIRMMVGRELKKWGGPPGPRPTPSSACSAAAEEPAGGPAADQGVRPTETVLAVSDLTTAKLSGVAFELHKGEVLGVAGLVGAGRSELGAALAGLDPIRRGSIRLQGRLGLVPEDRKLQGLMMQMSIAENSTLAVLKRMQSFGFVRTRLEIGAMRGVHERLTLKCASHAAPVSSLSGGNQQKVLLARWLLADPDVLFLDDPTRGIDVAAKHDIYEMIGQLAAAGKGVIFVSSELPELLQCSDRIMVLNKGRVAAFYDAAHVTQEEIMKSAMEETP